MAVIVNTEKPRRLLLAIKQAIDEGQIKTWSYDQDGDFTHTADQWMKRAWLRPNIQDGRIVFNVIPPKLRAVSQVVYGIYHGRFIEMLLNHFDKEFEDALATALATSSDRLKS